MMRFSGRAIIVAGVFAVLCATVAAGFATPEEEAIEHKRLYTQPDPEASGGLTGRIASPAMPIRQIVAVSVARPEHVYRGTLTDSERRTFRFSGLPMDRYDLVVFYENAVYEGLRLERDDSTLTPVDLKQIEDIIQRSEPFFTIKILHRAEGQTGRGNLARAFCTMARDRMAEMYVGPIQRTGLRRTHKLVMLKQVGPGWQIARARDLYPVWIEMHEPERLRPAHHYCEDLSGFRVTRDVRDIGALSL